MVDVDAILGSLFRLAYSVPEGEEIDLGLVMEKRNDRFLSDPYWSIWREFGECFAFFEGFFHKQESNNQLSRLNEEGREYFMSPEALLARFVAWEELSEFFLQNGITRMRNVHARNIFLAACRLVNEFGSAVPNSRWQLLGFAGYGRKIANMFLNLALDKPEIAIDVRVFKAGIKYGILPDEFAGKFNEFKIEAEFIIREAVRGSELAIEADYLLFLHGDGDEPRGVVVK